MWLLPSCWLCKCSMFADDTALITNSHDKADRVEVATFFE